MDILVNEVAQLKTQLLTMTQNHSLDGDTAAAARAAADVGAEMLQQAFVNFTRHIYDMRDDDHHSRRHRRHHGSFDSQSLSINANGRVGRQWHCSTLPLGVSAWVNDINYYDYKGKVKFSRTRNQRWARN